MTGRFPLGKGSLSPISDADLARLVGAGVELELHERCAGTGIRERYRDGDGELVEEPCRECAGRGCLTWDGHCIPEVLRMGALRCKQCHVSTLALGDACDCCAVCGGSPDEQCGPHEPAAPAVLLAWRAADEAEGAEALELWRPLPCLADVMNAQEAA